MLNKDVFVRDTLRLVTSEIKRFEVDNRKDPTDEDIVAILKRMAKQRKDSIQQYKDGGRPDFCLLYTSPSPRDKRQSRMPSSA